MLKKSHLSVTLFFISTLIGFSQTAISDKARVIGLVEAVNLGIQNNRQLKMANTDVQIANEMVSQTKMARTPRIGINSNYNYIGNPKVYEGFYENSTTIDYYDHQANGNIVGSVPLYLGGVINKQIGQQLLFSQLQESIVKMTEAEIKLNIAQQFFTLEKLYRQIEATKQNIENTELRIKQLKSRVENGQNLKSDLLRTEMQQSNFKVSIYQSSNDIKLISNYLDILIGLPADTILKPDLAGIKLPTEEINLQQSLAEAYQNRVEIKQSELRVQMTESSLGITKSGYLPYINANIILNSQYPAQWPNYTNNVLNYWATGVSLNWDISSFYNLKHKINSDKLDIDKSRIALEATKDRIDTDVNKAYVKYAESKEVIPTFKKDVELSQSNYKIVKSRYDNDFALISDMVDAEVQLNSSKISLINANLDLMIQYYSLQFAMGKL
jgi:outer membrane protein TolC